MRPSDIANEVAGCLGVPVSTVDLHSRNLREAGIRPKSPRGRGAGTLTLKDHANLIIAVAASRNVKDSAAMVSLYGALEARVPPAWGDRTWGRTFGEALTELLEVVPANREDFGGEDATRITVSLYGPRPRATIEVWSKPIAEAPTHTFLYEQRPQRGERVQFADLTYISQFTQITLGLVGDAIAGETAASK